MSGRTSTLDAAAQGSDIVPYVGAITGRSSLEHWSGSDQTDGETRLEMQSSRSEVSKTLSRPMRVILVTGAIPTMSGR